MSKRNWVLAFLVLAALMLCTQALASPIIFDFEDLYPGYEGNGWFPTDYHEASGFNFGSSVGMFWAWNTKYVSSDLGIQNGTIGNVSAAIPVVPSYSEAIGLYSYDFGFHFLGAYMCTTTSDYNLKGGPVPVMVQGYAYPPLMPRTGHTGNPAYTQIIYLTDQTHYFTFDWGAVTDVDIYAYPSANFNVIIDNVKVNLTAPIPASILLFSTGLGFMVFPFARKLVAKI